jgi:hypothetical protein
LVGALSGYGPFGAEGTAGDPNSKADAGTIVLAFAKKFLLDDASADPELTRVA